MVGVRTFTFLWDDRCSIVMGDGTVLNQSDISMVMPLSNVLINIVCTSRETHERRLCTFPIELFYIDRNDEGDLEVNPNYSVDWDCLLEPEEREELHRFNSTQWVVEETNSMSYMEEGSNGTQYETYVWSGSNSLIVNFDPNEYFPDLSPLLLSHWTVELDGRKGLTRPYISVYDYVLVSKPFSSYWMVRSRAYTTWCEVHMKYWNKGLTLE